jgi:ribonuclease E
LRIRPTTNKRNREQALRDHQIEKAERKKRRRENPDDGPEIPQGDAASPVDVAMPLIAVKPVLSPVVSNGAAVSNGTAVSIVDAGLVAASPEVQVIAIKAVVAVAEARTVAPEVIAVVAETVVAVPEVQVITEPIIAAPPADAVAPEVTTVAAEPPAIAMPQLLAVASEPVAALPEVAVAEVAAPEVAVAEVAAPEVLAAESEGLAGVPDVAPVGAKRPAGRARASSARDGEAPRSTRPATDVAVSAKPESAAARQSQTLLIAGVEAVSGAWVEELRHSLRRERRPISGGWPGTLSEARHRVAVCLLPWLQQRGGVVHYNQSPPTEVARQLNSAARRAWLMQSEADHEPWEAHAEGAADPSA